VLIIKILLITQHYPPDLGASAFRFSALAEELSRQDHQVEVLCGTPHRYGDMDFAVNEAEEGINIERVVVKSSGNTLFKRIKGYLEFYLGALKKIKVYKNKQLDAVVATTPPLSIAMLGSAYAGRLKVKYVLDVRDLWPDTPVALGKIKEKSFVTKILCYLERKCYAKADLITCTSPGFIEHIKKSASGQVEVVLNGIDSEFLQLCIEDNKVDHNMRNQFEILYAGNIGVCQNLMTLARAAKECPDVSFKLIGSGTQVADIEAFIRSNGCSNITILPPVKRSELISHYQKADALYLQLYGHEYFSKVIPSKVFEYLALAKPVIYGLEGEAKKILQDFEGTYYYPPDNKEELVKVIRQVQKMSEKIDRSKESLNDLSREVQTKKMIIHIEETVMEAKGERA